MGIPIPGKTVFILRQVLHSLPRPRCIDAKFTYLFKIKSIKFSYNVFDLFSCGYLVYVYMHQLIGRGEAILFHKISPTLVQVMTRCLWWHQVIKSPRYTGGDFLFLYRFVRRRRRWPQVLVNAITFEQLFGFLLFLALLLALTYKLPY